MVDSRTIANRSTPFTGDPSLIQPVIPDQIFHATDTGLLYVANSLSQGDISVYGGSNSGGGSEIIPGYLTCQCYSPYYHTTDYGGDQSHRLSGKAIRILKEGSYTFNIKITSEMESKLPTATEITTDGLDANKIIEVHRWSQPPNGGEEYSVVTGNSADPQGREWVADLPREGGSATVTIDSTFKWVSIMARNYDNNNNHSYPNSGSGGFDGVYLQWHNTTDIWLWTFSDNLDLSPEINATNEYDATKT